MTAIEDMAMQPGDVLLGKYRVERVLGRGGMGFVVAARHVGLDELFAIKFMHPNSLSNTEAVERFLREARASARLKGEHVARVHDVGRLENNAPFMVMEHLAGEDLSQLLEKRGVLPVGEASLYVSQACEAIAEAHGQGIVHRDLKPSNLFLTTRPNGTPCVKVLDFGISKQVAAVNPLGPALTMTGAFMGSPAFMSPEQMVNFKNADSRTDIWALGVILFELTTGAYPFHAEVMTELVAKVLQQSATPPSQLRPCIPAAFDAVVLKCLEKKPHRRFQTVQDLIDALRPFVEEKTPIRIVTASGLPPADDGPNSEATTRIEKPGAPGHSTSSQPMAVPHVLLALQEHTAEMTTQIRRSDPASKPVSGKTNEGMGGKRKSPALLGMMGLLMGLGGIVVLGGVALMIHRLTGAEAITEVGEERSARHAPPASASAEPLVQVMPAQSSAVPNAPAARTSAKQGDSVAPKPTASSAPPTMSTAKPPKRTIKPQLY